MINGLLLIDKPKGWTSFDVVAKVRGIIKAEVRKSNPTIKNIKVGHTGTLDPAATGLLVLCIGKATKRVPELIKHDKTYEVEITLGATSTTDDQEGDITQRLGVVEPHFDRVQKVIKEYIGEQMQVPPQFSALKINGKKAYELARKGKSVDLKARPVTIHRIDDMKYHWPTIHFKAHVSSGTYIRSLARDIGESLGCGAYMSNLRRTHIENYNITDAVNVEELNWDVISSTIMDTSI